jgi:hypothetical protein
VKPVCVCLAACTHAGGDGEPWVAGSAPAGCLLVTGRSYTSPVSCGGAEVPPALHPSDQLLFLLPVEASGAPPSWSVVGPPVRARPTGTGELQVCIPEGRWCVTRTANPSIPRDCFVPRRSSPRLPSLGGRAALGRAMRRSELPARRRALQGPLPTLPAAEQLAGLRSVEWRLGRGRERRTGRGLFTRVRAHLDRRR